MPSQAQLSLCIPELRSARELQEFYDSVNQFFLKFPLQYEVLFGVDRSTQDEGRALLQTLSEKDPRFRGIEMKSAQSRAARLEFLFSNGKADMLVAGLMDLAVPLGEVFKMLQELVTDPSVQAVFGNRFVKKKAAITTDAPLVRSKFESFFQGVIAEKSNWPYKDLFCPVFALKKSAFEKIKPQLKSKGSHWTPEIQRAVIKENLLAVEVPVFVHSKGQGAGTDAGFKPKTASGENSSFADTLRMLSFVLFRI